MSLKRKLPLLLGILSIFVIIMGIGLATSIQRVTIYVTYEGLPFPHSEFTRPYVDLGNAVLLFGIFLIVVALYGNYRQNKNSKTDEEVPAPTVETFINKKR